MAESQSRTCARSQKLRPTDGTRCVAIETFESKRPNKNSQLEQASCFRLDRPMTNPQGAHAGARLTGATAGRSGSTAFALTRLAVTIDSEGVNAG